MARKTHPSGLAKVCSNHEEDGVFADGPNKGKRFHQFQSDHDGSIHTFYEAMPGQWDDEPWFATYRYKLQRLARKLGVELIEEEPSTSSPV